MKRLLKLCAEKYSKEYSKKKAIPKKHLDNLIFLYMKKKKIGKVTEVDIDEVAIKCMNTRLTDTQFANLYAAVDLVSDKLERQIRKNKTKARKNLKQTIVFTDFEVDASEDVDNSIVKRKVVDTKPMSEEEAILQMELIGHDFFLFKNDKTNELCVVYKRDEGGYGILEAKAK